MLRRVFAAALFAAVVLAPVPAEASTAAPGAAVPFTTYEAESAATSGTRVGPSHAFTTLAAEASGRRAVSLRAGQWVEFTLAARADAVNVRYSVPDGSPAAKLRVSTGAELALTDRYSHVYGNYPYTNDPADGGEHHYFDDAHVLLGRVLAPGARVRFTATAPVVIDLADFELAGPPAARPAGSLSVTDFGADPTGATDAGEAIQAALDAGKAQAKGVWLPAGTYRVQRQLRVDAVSLRGAGPWHTVLRGAGVGVYGAGTEAVHLAGFAIAGDTVVRDDTTSDSGLGGTMGGGSTVDDVWIEHTKVGMWFDGPSDGLTVSHARIQDTMADGINLHNGVAHTVVRDTFVRNTGDDGLAMWSDGGADHDNAFVHDTVVAPLLANGFAIYGGHDNAVTDSVAADTVTQGGGVHVGNRFGAVPLSGTTTIARNVLLRAGNLVPNPPEEVAALWFYAADAPMTGAVDVHDVSIVDSPYAAVQFFGQRIDNVRLERVAIVRAGTFALQLQAPGSARLSWVVAAGVGAAGRYDCGGFALDRGPGNLGWTSARCGFPPAGALRLSDDSLDFGSQALHTAGAKTFTIANPGPDPVTVRALHAPAGYTATGPCATIPVGGSCPVTVTFAPDHAGVYADRLMIDSTSPAGPYVVAVRGVGFDPDGNLALGQQITASSQALSWLGPANLVDGDPGTYFESANNAFPQTVTLDLGAERSVGRLVLRLPANWGARAETIAVAAGGTTLVPSADYTLDPGTGNAVTITVAPTTVRTLTLTFTANTGWPAAQLSELEVYAR